REVASPPAAVGAVEAAVAYPMTSNACRPPWWWSRWWCPNNTGATWVAPGPAVDAEAGTEAACAIGRAPNSITPATALARTAPAARRRAEESEIDILVAPLVIWRLAARTLNCLP